jgi:Kyakuja-Dileera-Zisupton transposase
MACTDGEDPERWWAHINPMSMSTKEMGPGAWLDMLDDYAGAWNWQKITGFGECFKLVIDRFAALILFYSI